MTIKRLLPSILICILNVASIRSSMMPSSMMPTATNMDCPKVEPMDDISLQNVTGTWYLIASATSPDNSPDFSGIGDQLVGATCAKFNISYDNPQLITSEQWISCDNTTLLNFTFTATIDGNCDGYFYPPDTEVETLEVFGYKLQKVVKPIGVVLYTDYTRLLVTYTYYRVNSWLSMTQCYRTAAVFVRNRTVDAFAEIYPRLTPLAQLGFDLGKLFLTKNDNTCWN